MVGYGYRKRNFGKNKMKIAIQAADLDADRIDGTRVYILNLLKRFGKISPQDDFYIYHRSAFNPELALPESSNYKIKKVKSPAFWTQLGFAGEIWKDEPDVLWMPMHNIPFAKRKNLKTVATVHDLAFKYFPEYFPESDLRRLNFLLGAVARRADRLIAVSQSTKNDLLKFYPFLKEENIKVIYHGFDAELFDKKFTEEEKEKILSKYQILNTRYLLYVGAIQPRKDLETLVRAFNEVKKVQPELKLVLAGEKAWLFEETMKEIEKSPWKKDIILPGNVPFSDLPALYQSAEIFVFPSLYEGFGIPVLEAFASGIPVITAKNSSLPEVGGEAVLYFEEKNGQDLAEKIKRLLDDKSLKEIFIAKGKEQLKKFSWDKCAQETLDFLKN